MRRFTRKRVVTLIAGLLIVAVVLVASSHDSAPMPVYQGKTAREWMGYLGDSHDEDAEDAFRQMGARVVPYLLRELEKKDSVWERLLRWSYRKLPERVFRHLPAVVPRFQVELALKDAHSREAIPPLVRLLGSKNEYQRASALDVLETLLGPGDTNCISSVSKCLNTTNVYVSVEAACVLRRINAVNLAIPALTNFISSTNWQERLYCLDSLANIDSVNSNKWQQMLTNDPDWQAEHR